MSNPVWSWLIESRLSAYHANELFSGDSAITAGPGWCFERFGQSASQLPDGRIVHVAGEHEDSYDPDFFIYNDVAVALPTGELEIFGYTTDVFPPTDFHSATLLRRAATPKARRTMESGSQGASEHRSLITRCQFAVPFWQFHVVIYSGLLRQLIRFWAKGAAVSPGRTPHYLAGPSGPAYRFVENGRRQVLSAYDRSYIEMARSAR